MNAESIRDAIHLLEKAVRIIEADERFGSDPEPIIKEVIERLEKL